MKTKISLFVSMCALALGPIFSQNSGDISHNGMYNLVHDEAHCNSQINLTHLTTISNSFLGDSVKFIDYSGQLLYAEENTSGNPTWFINPPFYDGSVVSDEYVIGGVLNSIFGGILWKIISDNDTLYNPIIPINELIANACTYGDVSGNVYLDHNSNCIFDSGDDAISSLLISTNSNNTSPAGNYNLNYGNYSNGAGYYSQKVQESWMTSYQVSLPSIYAFIFPPSTCSPVSYSFTSLPQTDADFAVQCANLDASVYLGSNGLVRPLVPFNLFPNVSNIGCDPVSGTLKLVLDPNVTYNAANSSNPATSIVGDTLFWNYSNLTNVSNGAYWNSFFGGVELTPNSNVNIGDTLCFKVITGIPTNDINPMNNEYIRCFPVVNSFDPNIKEVEPKGLGAEGYIAPSTPKLTYTVHFQNTGNADAMNIYVMDTLDANVIPSTLKIIDASHTMIPEWKAANVIRFNFNGIFLPDSTSNEPDSHGYVVFEIDMTQGLAEGTEITNKAEIYFDFNPAIITNTALNTIQTPLGIEDLQLTASDFKVLVYPNPMTDLVNISIQNNGKAPQHAQVKIMDISGKLMIDKKVNNTDLITIQRDQLINGIYLVEVIDLDADQHHFGKLIVR